MTPEIVVAVAVALGLIWLFLRRRPQAPMPGPRSTVQPPEQTVSTPGVPTLLLRYRDSEGKETERAFDLKQVTFVPQRDAPKITHLIGFCHQRRALRTFRTDRIISLAVAETGELIDVAKLVKG